MKKVYLILLYICILNIKLLAQNTDSADFDKRPSSINEVIKQLGGDTVLFYYNDSWQMVKPVCATKFRITRVDSVSIMFTGSFVDYYADSTVAVQGNYAKGKKEGNFKIYFPNDQVEQAGRYSNDNKQGIWEYYYANGNKKQIFDFKGNDILILQFWDEQGQHLVDSGNGNWYGYEDAEKFMKVTGKVVNGKKDGKWERSMPSRNFITNTEKYKDGNFINGKMTSFANGSETYRDKVYCLVEQAPAFVKAEQFQISQCFRTQNYISRDTMVFKEASFPGGMTRFYNEIKQRLVLRGSYHTPMLIQVRMTIDTKGEMTDFAVVTYTGYENDLISVLHSMDKWKPATINGKPTTQTRTVGIEIR